MLKSCSSLLAIIIFAIHLNVIAQPCSLSVSATSYSVCPGFQSTLTAFGANSYTWTAGSFSAPVYGSTISVGAGTYLVSGNVSTCSMVVSIGQQAPLNIQASQSSATTCIQSNSPMFSKPVVLTAQGASYYTWFSSLALPNMPASGISVTTRPPASCCYTVVGTTAVCSGSAVVCVNVIPQYSITVVPMQATICAGDAIQLSITTIGGFSGGPPFTYSWTEMGSTLNNNLTPTVIANPTSATNYTTMVSDSRNCISLPVTSSITVNACTGISKVENDQPVSIFPNPFGSSLSLRVNDDDLVELTDVLGKLVMTAIQAGGTRTFDTSQLVPGIYFVSVTKPQQQKLRVKVVKSE